MPAKTKEQFIEDAKNKYKDKYNYSEVEYTNNHTKVKIICNECKKELLITPKDFLRRGHKCKIKKEKIKIKKPSNKELFKEKVELKYPDKFQFNENDYTTNKNKIIMFCNDCGNIVSVRPDTLLSSRTVYGCKFCEMILKKARNIKFRKTTEQFIEDAKKVHGDKYDYSKIKYINNSTPIGIIHKKCGKVFWQKPLKHLQGRGCLKCCGRNRTTEEAVEILKSIFGDIYDYSKVEYVKATEPITLICKKHNKEFTSNYHVLTSYRNRRCCPEEWQSKPNLLIKNILDKMNIYNLPEYKFEDCVFSKKLIFDFYVPEKNIVIEYQGEWHYFDFQGSLKIQKERDQIKRDFCKEKGIKELEIPYWEFDNIEKILKEKLN